MLGVPYYNGPQNPILITKAPISQNPINRSLIEPFKGTPFSLLRPLEELRSKSELNVHELASEYGGGGHRNASGIVMDGELEAVARQITDRVRRGLEALGSAR